MARHLRHSKQKPRAVSPLLALGLSPRLLRRAEAASYLQISTAHLDELRAAGHLQPVAVPSAHGPKSATRIPLFDKADLDQCIDLWKTQETGQL